MELFWDLEKKAKINDKLLPNNHNTPSLIWENLKHEFEILSFCHSTQVSSDIAWIWVTLCNYVCKAVKNLSTL